MFIPFDELQADARIWIYQADRPLSEQEVKLINEAGKSFIDQWNAHGNPLKGSLKIYDYRFVILGVDQGFNEASGCSIDGSVNFIKSLQEQFSKNESISFLESGLVAFKKGNNIELIDFRNIKNKIKEGVITPDTLTFNNRIEQKSQLDNEWMIPARDSWMGKYFESVAS